MMILFYNIHDTNGLDEIWLLHNIIIIVIIIIHYMYYFSTFSSD